MTRDIVINGRFLSRCVTGVERYGREIHSLIGNRCRVEMTRVNGLSGHAWEQFALPARLKPGSILWSPANTGPLMVRNQALTIHDLSPLEHPEWFKKSFALWYRQFLPKLAKRVPIVFTPSEYVREKVIKRFGAGNVIVTPNGVDTSRFHSSAVQCTYELPEKFIFFVGSLQPRKNLPALLKVWREIRDDYPEMWLLLAGKAGEIFGRMDVPTDQRVRFLSYVAEDDLAGLYAKAMLFVLPSFDEGFGLPALEAMACGTPVIVSDGGALPETIGNAGFIFKLSDSNGLSTAIRECLNNSGLRSSLIANGYERIKDFSWRRSAELIWKTLNEI